jgi:hypothetical protein
MGIKSCQMPFTIPLDTNGHPLPPPCPSECVSTLPSDMWGAYWFYSKEGTLPLPATVPYRLSVFDKGWADAVRRWKGLHGGVPKIWKAYWGKFMTDSKPLDMEGATLPDEFWLEYLHKHPDGHWEDETNNDLPPVPWTPGPRAEDRTGYYLIRGKLCYRHTNGVTYEATGVDSFPPM